MYTHDMDNMMSRTQIKAIILLLLQYLVKQDSKMSIFLLMGDSSKGKESPKLLKSIQGVVKKMDIEEEVAQMVNEAPFSTLIKLVNDVEFRSSSSNMKLLFNFIADLMKSFSDDVRERRSPKGYLIDKSTIAHLSDSIALKAIDDELLKRIATFIYEVCKNPQNFKHVLHEVKHKVLILYKSLGYKYLQLCERVPRSASLGAAVENMSPHSKLSD